MEVIPWNGTNHSSGHSYKADLLFWSAGGPQLREDYCEKEGPSGSLNNCRPCWRAYEGLQGGERLVAAVRSSPDNHGGFEAIFTWDGRPAICPSCGSKIRVRDDSPIEFPNHIKCPSCTSSRIRGYAGAIWYCRDCETNGTIVSGSLKIAEEKPNEPDQDR